MSQKNVPLLGTQNVRLFVFRNYTSLLGLKFWLQGVLMRTLCCRSFKSNWCLVSACKASQLFGSQEWDIFFGTPCSIELWFRQKKVQRSDASGLCISQWSSGLSSNYDWRDKMLVVLFPPKSSLDSLSHSLAYLKDWQHVATDTFKQQTHSSNRF